MSFDTLKTNRTNAIADLVTAAAKVSGGNKYTNTGDDKMWKPTVDKAGNGYAVIRFLPTAEGGKLPWVQYWDHGFKGPTGRWYIEKSLTSIQQEDPLSQYNSKLWNSGIEADKDTCRRQKRRLHYVSNIYVVSDPGNPDSEGKVFMYQYGKKIFDKIQDVMNPQFEDEKAINAFDLWDGADFRIKIQNVEGFRNYDKSGFDNSKPLCDGDDTRLREIYSLEHNIEIFIDPAEYKTFAELQKKLIDVVGRDAVMGDLAHPQESASPMAAQPAPDLSAKPAFAEPEKSAPVDTSEDMTEPNEESGEDTLSYFANLAKG